MPTGICDYAAGVRDRLAAAGLRVELDERQEKIGYKIREAQLQKVPYMLVVGRPRERPKARCRCAAAPAATRARSRSTSSSPDALDEIARKDRRRSRQPQRLSEPALRSACRRPLSLSTERPDVTTAFASTNASASAKSASSTTPASSSASCRRRRRWPSRKQKGLDLVEISPTAVPPVCRIMDFGKYQYQEQKRAREAKKHQKVIEVKEIKFRPKVDEHDYQFKKKHIERFLEDGDKVKATIFFRGREMAHPGDRAAHSRAADRRAGGRRRSPRRCRGRKATRCTRS